MSLMETYRRYPVTFERGEGVWLIDDAGRRYLDLLAGIAVCSLGHAHPALTDALRRQAGRLVHVSNLFSTEENEAAAAALCGKLGGGAVFFCNSGAEANEAAVKLARKHHWRGGEPGRNRIAALDGSFHGRYGTSLAATIQPAKWEGFQPLAPGVTGVPRDLDAIDRVVGDRTAAVIVESVLGEGGIRPLDHDLLVGIRRITAERGALLICDEIQTGVARTGRWWGFQHAGIQPDIVTMAKGLGGGVPVGATWATDEVASSFRPGDHATTYGGNPLASVAVSTVLDVIEREGLVEAAARVGARLTEALAPLGEVRGLGLLLAVDLGDPIASDVVSAALQEGLVCNAVTPSAIRLAPPLVITEEEALEGARRLHQAVGAVR